MRKVRWIFEVAEHRHAVRFGHAIVGPRHAYPWQTKRARAQTQRMPARQKRCARRAAQERLPILGALSASHHHSVGKPVTLYLGSGWGWLKRSQRAARSKPAANCGTT